MRLRTLSAVAALALVSCAAGARAQEQKQDEQVIEDFVITRGVSFDTPGAKKKPAKPAPAPRKNSASGKGASGAAASSKSGGKGSASGKSGKQTSGANTGGAGEVTAQAGGQTSDAAGAQVLNAAAGAARPLALGYTILLKDGAGRLSVVDASREFKTGDNIAIALESNADGYLYMFNASDGKNPELLFPNVQLDGGANSLQAHARATFPADPTLDFRFTDPPAREHLFVVFTREPLPGVPAGEALAQFCGANTDDCAWKPPAALWERIRGGAKGHGVTEARNAQLAQGQAQPAAPQTLQRGLKVKRDDPKPAVVRVNQSPAADILVTEIVLVHK